jgi:hypothetical protein
MAFSTGFCAIGLPLAVSFGLNPLGLAPANPSDPNMGPLVSRQPSRLRTKAPDLYSVTGIPLLPQSAPAFLDRLHTYLDS